MITTVSILGSTVHLVDMPWIRSRLDSWAMATDGRCRQMVVTGFHGLLRAQSDPKYRRVARGADLWVPDGIAPVAIARLRGIRGVVRTPGAEILRTWLELAHERGYSSYFYGDTDFTLAALRERVELSYPAHRFAGAYSPPFRPLSQAEDQKTIDRINDASPDIVWVGLGMPKQDVWAWEHSPRLHAKAVIGIGAAFGFLAGTVNRCPSWIGNHGMEWAYRLIAEPRKLWRRDFIEGPAFLWHVLLEQLKLRRYE